jgi:YD repeat-containing protein
VAITSFWTYDPLTGLLASFLQGGVSKTHYEPASAQGLFRPVKGHPYGVTIDAQGGITATQRWSSASVLSDFPLVEESLGVAGDIQGAIASARNHSGVERTIAPDGATLTRVRDAKGRITLSIDPQGNIIFYYHDYWGNVTLELLPHLADTTILPSRSYEYEPLYLRLREINDERGNITQVTYDDDHHRKVETNALLQTTIYTYFPNGLLQSVEDPLHNVTNYGYDDYRRLTGVYHSDGTSERYTYDNYGNLLTFTDALGRVSRSEYDNMGHLLSQVDVYGNVTSFVYDGAGLPRYTTDPAGRITRTDYDSLARPIRRTELYGTSGAVVTTTDYDGNGKAIAVHDAEGVTRTSRYDSSGRPVEVTEAVGTPEERHTFTTYYPGGRIWQQISPLGLLTRHEYDDPHRRTVDTVAFGSATDQQTITTRNVAGNVVRVEQPDSTAAYDYDALNRQRAVTQGAGTYAAHTTSTSFDADGRVKTVTNWEGVTTRYDYFDDSHLVVTVEAAGTPLERSSETYHDAVGRVTLVIGPTGLQTHTAYLDAQRRIVVTTDGPNGTLTTRTDYDTVGRPLREERPTGLVVRYKYFDVARRVDVIEGTDDCTQADRVTTTYSDPLGRPTLVIDPDGNRTRTAYDPLGRAIRETTPLGFRTSTYDLGDHVTSTLDRDGRLRQFRYDLLGHETAEIWVGTNGQAVNTIRWEYDTAGHLRRVSDNNSAYDLWDYDPLGRPQASDDIGTPTLPYIEQQRQYDVPSELGYSDQEQTTIAGLLGAAAQTWYHDLLGRSSRTDQGSSFGGTQSVAFTYTPLDQPETITRNSSLTTSYAYGAGGALQTLTHTWNGVPLAEYSWTYNTNGRVQTLSTPDGTSTFHYDELDELTSVDPAPPDAVPYHYDANGNRLEQGTVIDPGNLLVLDSRFAYAYDGEGNLIRRTDLQSGEVTEYAWDYRNRLTHVVRTTPGDAGQMEVTAEARYTYDALDQRIGRWADADGSGPLAAVTQEFAWAGGQGNRIKSPLGLFGRAVDFVKGATNDTPQVEIQPRR